MTKPDSITDDDDDDSSSHNWDFIGSDLTELILSRLPIPSVIRASSVCKFWNSVIHSHSFTFRVSNSNTLLPWLFFSGQNNSRVFAFDPESHDWIKLPHTFLQQKEKFSSKSGFSRFDNQGCLDIEIYNPELCPPLPDIFLHGNSSQLLCSALFQEKLYIFGIHSSFISSLDLKTRSWSNVRTLRPPGVLYSYLISCNDRLVLAGVCSVNDELEFNLWEINERTLEFREIGIMPPELVSCFFGFEEERRFGNLKCVGSGNIVYVFSKEGDLNIYPICVCEIKNSGECSWRSVPDLPEPGIKFQEIFGFCYDVSLQDFLGDAEV